MQSVPNRTATIFALVLYRVSETAAVLLACTGVMMLVTVSPLLGFELLIVGALAGVVSRPAKRAYEVLRSRPTIIDP
ncbi:G protein-activated inward rectifier potassium channel 2 [Microbacterium sp. HM58-2]|nr:G protein-activated inward rectifier potassium channel 2 [Microbacterium sp. HM58-2]